MAQPKTNTPALVSAIRSQQYEVAHQRFAEAMAAKLTARTQQEYAQVAKNFITDGGQS